MMSQSEGGFTANCEVDDDLTVLLVTTCLGGGGAERHVVHLANYLIESLHVEIAVLRPNGSYEEFLSPDVSVTTISSALVRRSSWLAAYSAVRPLASLLSSKRFDVVLTFLDPATYLFNQAAKSLEPRPCWIVAVQNNFADTLSTFDSPHLAYFRKGFFDAICNCDHLCMISSGVAESVDASIPLSLGKSTVIYNTVEPVRPGWSNVSNNSSGLNVSQCGTASFQLVACGRFVRQKGFFDLLTAFSLLIKRHTAVLTLIGQGPLEEALRTRVRDLELEHFVRFTGFVAEPRSIFAKSDLFLLSSHWEGFGNVIVESMSVGTPVVATRCPYGPDEIITHGHDGMLVPVGDPPAMAETASQLLSNPARIEQLSQNAVKRAADFRPEIIGAQYLDMIERVCSDAV